MRFLLLFFICLTFACRSNALALSLALPKSVILSLSNQYSGCLLTHPLLTNVLTASSLCVLSDSISQSFERSNQRSALVKSTETEVIPRAAEGHSWYRSFCMSVYGATVYGWLITYWFKFLNRLVPQENITFALVIKKVLINQLFMSPLLNGMFFTYVTLTRDVTSTISRKIEQIKLKLSKDLLPTIKRSCVYWGIVQFVNFSYVATKYQLLYTNSAFVVWTTYIAYVGFRKLEST